MISGCPARPHPHRRDAPPVRSSRGDRRGAAAGARRAGHGEALGGRRRSVPCRSPPHQPHRPHGGALQDCGTFGPGGSGQGCRTLAASSRRSTFFVSSGRRLRVERLVWDPERTGFVEAAASVFDTPPTDGRKRLPASASSFQLPASRFQLPASRFRFRFPAKRKSRCFKPAPWRNLAALDSRGLRDQATTVSALARSAGASTASRRRGLSTAPGRDIRRCAGMTCAVCTRGSRQSSSARRCRGRSTPRRAPRDDARRPGRRRSRRPAWPRPRKGRCPRRTIRARSPTRRWRSSARAAAAGRFRNRAVRFVRHDAEADVVAGGALTLRPENEALEAVHRRRRRRDEARDLLRRQQRQQRRRVREPKLTKREAGSRQDRERLTPVDGRRGGNRGKGRIRRGSRVTRMLLR